MVFAGWKALGWRGSRDVGKLCALRRCSLPTPLSTAPRPQRRAEHALHVSRRPAPHPTPALLHSLLLLAHLVAPFPNVSNRKSGHPQVATPCKHICPSCRLPSLLLQSIVLFMLMVRLIHYCSFQPHLAVIGGALAAALPDVLALLLVSVVVVLM